MAKIKLTKSAVDAAQPQAQAIELRDTVVPMTSGLHTMRSFPCSATRLRPVIACAFALPVELHSAQPSNLRATDLPQPPLHQNRVPSGMETEEGKIKGRGTTVRTKPVCTWS